MRSLFILALLTPILLGCTAKLNSIEDFSSGKYIKSLSVKKFTRQWSMVHNDKKYTFLTLAKKKKIKTVDFNFETDIIQLILTNNDGSDFKMNKYFRFTSVEKLDIF